jgi:adenine-specific DNA-methyltransferase
MTGMHDHLTHAKLIELLEKPGRTKKLGLVWERDEIAADAAVDEYVIACEIVSDLLDKAASLDNIVIEVHNFDTLRRLRMTHSGAVRHSVVAQPIRRWATSSMACFGSISPPV